MNSSKWILLFSVIIITIIQPVFAISNVQHTVDGNKVTISYQGTPPFWINLRGDANIGQDGGYLWAKTYSTSFSYDMSFAINPSKKFYYGVKDTDWSNTNNFVLGSTNLCDISNGHDNSWILLGPSDGRVSSIEYMNNKEIYAATSSGGVFRSSDKGNTWEHFSEGLESSKTSFLKAIGNKLYVTAGSGVYVLESGKWKNILKVDGAIFYTIDYDGFNGRLWSLADNGVYYSDDSGNSWKSAQVSGNSEKYNFLFISKNNEVYVSTENLMLKNSGTPDKWVKIFDKGAFNTIVGSTHPFTEDDDGNIYIFASDRNIYVRKSNQDVFKKSSIKATRGNLLYFNKVFFYEDGDNYFSVISDDGNNNIKTITSEIGAKGIWDIREMYPIIDENKILIANDNGVSELDLSTKTIKKLTPIPNNSETTSLAIIGNSNSLVTISWDHSSLLTKNCGLNWNAGPDDERNYVFGDPAKNIYLRKSQKTISLRESDLNPLWGIDCTSEPYIASIALDSLSSPTRAYALCEENNEGKLVSFDIVTDYSKSNGNLLKSNLPDKYVQGIAVDPTNPSRLIIVENEGVYESLDKGQNWNKIIDRPQGGLWRVIAINPLNSAEILIGGFNGNIFLVKNGQIKEMSVTTSISKARGFINTLTYDDKKPNIIYVGTSNGFYYSKDNGQTWQEFNKGLYSNDIRKIIPRDDRIFIGTWGSGIAVIFKKNLGLN